MNRTRWWKWVAPVATLLVVGCAGPRVSLVYTLPPQYKVPEGIREVAVVRFKALKRTDETYGEVAAAKLNQALIESGAYRVYSRRNLDKVIEELDFRESGMALANKVRTKLPSVDAIITGSVDAGAQYITEPRSYYDPAIKATRTIIVRHLICEATVTFEMLEVNTGRVIASVGEVAKYDSRQDAALMSLMAMVAGVPPQPTLPPPDTKLKELIDQCVHKFIAKIAPHQVRVPVRLELGRSEMVRRGNQFARNGMWREAADYYRQAVAADLDGRDHGAHFNLGVALEAQGKLREAAQEYRTAYRINPKQKYLQSLARVKRFGGF